MFIFAAVAWSNGFKQVREEIAGSREHKAIASVVWLLILFVMLSLALYSRLSNKLVHVLIIGLGGHIGGWACRDATSAFFTQICPGNLLLNVVFALAATFMSGVWSFGAQKLRHKFVHRSWHNHQMAELELEMLSTGAAWAWSKTISQSVLNEFKCPEDEESELNLSRLDIGILFLSIILVLVIAVSTTAGFEKRLSKGFIKPFGDVFVPLWTITWACVIGFTINSFLEALFPVPEHHTWEDVGLRFLFAIGSSTICFFVMTTASIGVARALDTPTSTAVPLKDTNNNNSLSQPLTSENGPTSSLSKVTSRIASRLDNKELRKRRQKRNLFLFTATGLVIGWVSESAFDRLLETMFEHQSTTTQLVLKLVFAMAVTGIVILMVIKRGWAKEQGHGGGSHVSASHGSTAENQLGHAENVKSHVATNDNSGDKPTNARESFVVTTDDVDEMQDDDEDDMYSMGITPYMS